MMVNQGKEIGRRGMDVVQMDLKKCNIPEDLVQDRSEEKQNFTIWALGCNIGSSRAILHHIPLHHNKRGEISQARISLGRETNHDNKSWLHYKRMGQLTFGGVHCMLKESERGRIKEANGKILVHFTTAGNN